MSRRTILLFLVVFAFGWMTGTAWAHGHTQGSIYHGPYYESRSGNDYHHCWTEHSHGLKYAGCANYEGNGYYHYCNATPSTQTHVHCTVYGFEGGGAGYTQTGSYTFCNNFEYEGAYSSYSDGHGVCSHYRNHST